MALSEIEAPAPDPFSTSAVLAARPAAGGGSTRVLLIKTSSIGDVVHALPALSDALAADPGLSVDWLVEEQLAPIVARHPAVARAIPVGLRRWRRAGTAPRLPAGVAAELRALWWTLRGRRYDAVIDAQGLYKSAALALLARGPRHGFSFASSRERLASFAYHHRHRVSWAEPAVDRLRRLFAGVFGYPLPDTPPDFGLDPAGFTAPDLRSPYLVLAHGTSRAAKSWPVARWRVLARRAGEAGFTVCLPAHGGAERGRAEEIAAGLDHARLLPPMSLERVAGWLANAAGVVSVDTGLGFLAVAVGAPSLMLYGPTVPQIAQQAVWNAHFVAADCACAPSLGKRCAVTGVADAPPPCLAAIDPEQVWTRLGAVMTADPRRR